MKVKFKNVDCLIDGIVLLQNELNFIVVEEDVELIVEAKNTDVNCVKVKLENAYAKIIYGGGISRFFRGLGLLFEALADGKTEFEREEFPCFSNNGGMFSTQEAVPNCDAIKMYMRKMTLMGLNTFQIYMEDSYQLPEYPYFGHMRGRYTKEELKDLDAYARKLGLELIPCVQFLGHLTNALKGESAKAYRDTRDNLLVRADATYTLIDHILQTISECFTSRRIHIGCDEAINIGRGVYMKKHGLHNQLDIFCEHISRVAQMAKGYGFKVMMWSDMFFSLLTEKEHKNGYFYDADVTFPKIVKEKISRDIDQVFWEYSNYDEEFHNALIKKHRELCDNMVFAGGIKVWQSSCPQYHESLRCMLPSLEACKKNGVKELFLTLWCGGEIPHTMTMPGLLIYAEFDYTGEYDNEHMRRRFKFLFGVDYDAFFDMEAADHVHQNEYPELASSFLLYNDPLIGLLDYHAQGLDTNTLYGKLLKDFGKYDVENTMFAPFFNVYRKMLSVLELKSDFGLRLKCAYDENDRQALTALADESTIIFERLEELRKARYTSWMYSNKAIRYEVFDCFLGTLLARFDTVKVRINSYMSGEIDKIEELEEERLPYDYSQFCNPSEENIFFLKNFHNIYTASV